MNQSNQTTNTNKANKKLLRAKVLAWSELNTYQTECLLNTFHEDSKAQVIK
jgi:hypothetical protein